MRFINKFKNMVPFWNFSDEKLINSKNDEFYLSLLDVTPKIFLYEEVLCGSPIYDSMSIPLKCKDSNLFSLVVNDERDGVILGSVLSDEISPFNYGDFYTSVNDSSLPNTYDVLGNDIIEHKQRKFKSLDEYVCFVNQLCGDEVCFSDADSVDIFLRKNISNFSSLENVITHTDSIFSANYIGSDGLSYFCKSSWNYRASSSQYFGVSGLRDLLGCDVGNPLRVCLLAYEDFKLIDGLAVTTSCDVNSKDNFSDLDLEVFNSLYDKFSSSLKSSDKSEALPDVILKNFESLDVKIDDNEFLQKLFIKSLVQQGLLCDGMSEIIEDKFYDLNPTPNFNSLVERCEVNLVDCLELESFRRQFGYEYNVSNLRVGLSSNVLCGACDIDVTEENSVLRESCNVYTLVDPLFVKNVPLAGFVENVNGPRYDSKEVFLAYSIASKISADFFGLNYNLSSEQLFNTASTFGLWRGINGVKIGAFRLINGGLEETLKVLK